MRSFWRGTRLVAAQELRLRTRKGRWRWMLGAWFALLLGFTFLVWLMLESIVSSNESASQVGTPLFGSLMLFMLALALLVVPSLAATSVNGDRERGTLATLQTTLLTPLQIATGKLLAAWSTALVFLATSLPMVVWCVILGGTSPARVAVAFGVLALLLGTLCAVSLAVSAIFARTTTSAVVSYVTVFMATVMTLVSFGILTALVTTEESVTYTYFDGTQQTATQSVAHPEYFWWIIAGNPYVVLADSAPSLPLVRDDYTNELRTQEADILGGIKFAARTTRVENFNATVDYRTSDAPVENPPALWPTGLAMNLVLGAIALGVTTRRLRTPIRNPGKGIRIA